MLENLVKVLRDIAYFSEQARRNSDELKDLRNKHHELALTVQRLALEIEKLRENEAHEREKLLLKIEKMLLAHLKESSKPAPKQLKKKNNLCVYTNHFTRVAS